MNQILSVENPKKEKKQKVRNHGTIEINKILKFFSIAIFIFGIFIIGSGSYSMYQEAAATKVATKPTIYVEETSETEIILQISHDKAIEKVIYQWNEEEPTQIEGKGKKKVEQKIEIPTGENTLNVYAIDVNGQEITYQKKYTLLGDININLEANGNNIKIIAEGKEELSYMTYRWDEEDEQTIEINNIQTEQTIEIPKGLHTLTVIVVDRNHKTQTKKQEIKGVTKPKLEVSTDGADNFIIKASDEEGIKRVEFIINETERNSLDLDKVLPLEQRKEFEYAYPLHDGENRLEIRVYNESDVSEVSKVLVRK
ncbi:MAG: hypothetical protein HFJ37_02095 [Clostridia bacterium]|nr:hypothetical protein [Clostridia bacterium]